VSRLRCAGGPKCVSRTPSTGVGTRPTPLGASARPRCLTLLAGRSKVSRETREGQQDVPDAQPGSVRLRSGDEADDLALRGARPLGDLTAWIVGGPPNVSRETRDPSVGLRLRGCSGSGWCSCFT
jgi:hypothetical protein